MKKKLTEKEKIRLTIIYGIVLILVIAISSPFIVKNDFIGYIQMGTLFFYSFFVYWKLNIIWNR